MNTLEHENGTKVLMTQGSKFATLVFDKLTDEIKKKIDDKFTTLREGAKEDNPQDLKELKQTFYEICLKESKKSKESHKNRQVGFIGELLSHLFLIDEKNDLGTFEPIFLFRNLEKEGDPKNGFDGVYIDPANNDALWLLEVKSARTDTTHNYKLNEAHKDITGYKKNNPWLNAYDHANQPVGADQTIKKSLKLLSNKFRDNNPPNVKEHNIILSAPIFINPTPDSHTHDAIIKALPKDLVAKDIRLIAMSVPFLDDIIAFFKGENT